MSIVQIGAKCIDVPLSTSEVYYYETRHENGLCTIFESKNKRERIDSIFNFYEKQFIYLPDWTTAENKSRLVESARYHNPRLNEVCDSDVEIPSYSSIAKSFHFLEPIQSPSLVRYCGSRDGQLFFSITAIESRDIRKLRSEFKHYLANCQDLKDDEPKETTSRHPYSHAMRLQTADDLFDTEVEIIGREIKERIERLRAKGLSAVAIKSLIDNADDSPSHLLIDKHNRLFLTDFNNREIKLSPLHKAVFFLFLKHPEGIYFKDMESYKEELYDIYSGITGREDAGAIDGSIDRLVNPYDNSINEKCARIKNAFVSEFREEIAQWYFIDGRKGEKKSIKLPREMVIWEIK